MIVLLLLTETDVTVPRRLTLTVIITVPVTPATAFGRYVLESTYLFSTLTFASTFGNVGLACGLLVAVDGAGDVDFGVDVAVDVEVDAGVVFWVGVIGAGFGRRDSSLTLDCRVFTFCSRALTFLLRASIFIESSPCERIDSANDSVFASSAAFNSSSILYVFHTVSTIRMRSRSFVSPLLSMLF